jgi:hypothetical protein
VLLSLHVNEHELNWIISVINCFLCLSWLILVTTLTVFLCLSLSRSRVIFLCVALSGVKRIKFDPNPYTSSKIERCRWFNGHTVGQTWQSICTFHSCVLRKVQEINMGRFSKWYNRPEREIYYLTATVSEIQNIRFFNSMPVACYFRKFLSSYLLMLLHKKPTFLLYINPTQFRVILYFVVWPSILITKWGIIRPLT